MALLSTLVTLFPSLSIVETFNPLRYGPALLYPINISPAFGAVLEFANEAIEDVNNSLYKK